ncbi:MAG: hypothetical protein MUF45_00735, partial [Spirosomaceae bacterium]|nr:hypothetical protein [Spirosomataceae bacterium]
MLKKLILSLILLPWGLVDGFSQVSTLPHSIGIGQNTISSIPFHIRKDGEVARFQGLSPYISFYEGNNFNGFIQAFSTSLGIGTKNSRDMIFYVNDIPRINISGSTGFITT